jgi:hypothetical protein
MGDYQTFGQKAPMKNGPRSMEPSGGNKGTMDNFGSTAPLKSSPSSNKPRMGGGTIEKFGTTAPLGNTPVKGYQGVPVSKRSAAQSK